MNAKSHFIAGALLLLVGVVAPIVNYKFGTDSRHPDIAEMESCCIAIPLILLSFLFILVGVLRLIYERSGKKWSSIVPPD